MDGIGPAFRQVVRSVSEKVTRGQPARNECLPAVFREMAKARNRGSVRHASFASRVIVGRTRGRRWARCRGVRSLAVSRPPRAGEPNGGAMIAGIIEIEGRPPVGWLRGRFGFANGLL